jgi:hypothetical protein
MHLGISVAEADEVVSSLAGGSAVSGGSSAVKLASLYDALQRAGEPDAEVLVDELREVTRERYLGRGAQFASAAAMAGGPRSEGGDFIPESEFRRCLAQAVMDDAIQATPPPPDDEDKAVLLAEKNAAGAVRWRHFATTYLGWQDEDYQSDPGSPANRRGPLPAFATTTQQTWRSGKTVPERTVPAFSPQKEQEADLLHARKPPGLKVVTETDGPKPGGCCRSLRRLVGGA